MYKKVYPIKLNNSKTIICTIFNKKFISSYFAVAAVLLCHPCAPTAYRPQRAPSVPAAGVAPCGWCNMSVAVAAVLLCHLCAPTAYRPQRAPSVPAAGVPKKNALALAGLCIQF